MKRERRTSRHSNHDEIAAILGAEIVSGIRKPNSRMPAVPEMLTRFGVSRVVMREVTRTLAAKGMLASKSRVGTLVLDPTHWNWFDPDVLAWRLKTGPDINFIERITEIRSAVEPAGAALAAKNRGPGDLTRLRQTVKAMHQATHNRHQFLETDLEFHLAVSAASGNPLFRSLAGVIETALFATFNLSSPADPKGLSQIASNHAAIVDAIEARDGDAAAQRMLYVIDDGISRIRPTLSKSTRKRK
jgi:DNA-binding FadR family transcriptional regulator